jgi:hypothetical protein
MPVAIGREQLDLVRGVAETYAEYAVSFKADGERRFLGFVMCNGAKSAFTMDRRGDVRPIVLEVCSTPVYTGTLLDVELVDSGVLVFDCAMAYGIRCVERIYPSRMEIADLVLSDMRKHQDNSVGDDAGGARPEGVYASRHGPARVRVGAYTIATKPLYYARDVRSALARGRDTVCDGLVWTCVTAPFPTFRKGDSTLLKWKPANRATVDFYLTDAPLQREFPAVFPGVASEYDSFRRRFGSHRMLVNADDSEQWFSTLDAAVEPGVYECAWGDGGWRVVAPRPDKDRSNHVRTLVDTLRDIVDPISEEEL